MFFFVVKTKDSPPQFFNDDFDLVDLIQDAAYFGDRQEAENFVNELWGDSTKPHWSQKLAIQKVHQAYI
jgi:hypothetical protein